MVRTVIVDKRAAKEIARFPQVARNRYQAILQVLTKGGLLREPVSKKLHGTSLFELRIQVQGQWRVLYAYVEKDMIIILSGFQKKTPKTPGKELHKAIQRLAEYLRR